MDYGFTAEMEKNLDKVAEGKEATLALPGPETRFEATGQYGIDGVTEKVLIDKSYWSLNFFEKLNFL